MKRYKVQLTRWYSQRVEELETSSGEDALEFAKQTKADWDLRSAVVIEINADGTISSVTVV